MKILVFTTLYPNNVWPNQGVFIMERMTQFARLGGCEVKVVAPVPYFPSIKANWRWRFSQVASSEVRDGIEVYHPRYYMTPKWGMALYGILMFLSVVLAVRKLRRDFDFDLIDAHFVYPDGFAAVLLGKYFNKPVVVSARGSDINQYSAFHIIRWMLRYTLTEAKTVIAVSQALKEAITRLGIRAEKVFVVPNGVDMKKFYPLPKESARRALGLPQKRILLSVGNLTANKGFDLLLKAFSRLSNDPRGRDLYLVIIGDGVMRRQLETLILHLSLLDKVRLVGAIPHDALNLWYNAADLFCLMSQKEGWPNVLLESLACGVPVVATAVGGIPEIVSSEHIGVLTERDEVKIEESIRAAFVKPWRVDELSEYAKNFSWDRAALRLHEIFGSALMARDACADGGALGQKTDNHSVGPSESQVGALIRNSKDQSAMKIMLIAGARPNFMKVASIVQAIRAYNDAASSPLEFLLVHTGQHYDKEMSDSFFTDLELPVPHVNLGVGSSSHARQTADIMTGIEPVLLRELPEVLVVVGDVNSTVACALVAAKIAFPTVSGLGMSRPLIAHVEAGLRSFDRSMPEEINRVLTDALCDLLFVTERDAEENLLREGVANEKIFFVGNTMVDTLLRHRQQAKRSGILARLGLTQDGAGPREILPYAATTLHRPSNVDDRQGFGAILDALKVIGARLPVFFPIHPRTLSRIREFGYQDYFDFSQLDGRGGFSWGQTGTSTNQQRSAADPRIIAFKPLGYLEFLCLMDNAKLVITDSGGIQEETTVLGVPCVTVRENTERPVTITQGTNVLAGTSTERIIHHCLMKLDHPEEPKQPELWDGYAGARIIEILSSQPGVTESR